MASCSCRRPTIIPRVAERIATLDLVSAGRVEWGTGQGASAAEMGGIGVDPDQRWAMWLEAVREAANMLATSPYRGYAGTYFSTPCRNVVPKPVQKPHPPIWCDDRRYLRIVERRRVLCARAYALNKGQAPRLSSPRARRPAP
jgi:hypothetical protein